MSSEKIRVLIVDDQRLLREGVRIILEDAPDLEVIGEAENGQLAVQMAARWQPDIILMDIRMPVLDGIGATEQISKQKQGHPKPHILLLTTFDMPDLVIEGMRAGAAGYLLKDCSAEELCTAVRAVGRGQVLLQASSAAQLLAGLKLKEPATGIRGPDLARSRAEESGLTARELEVVRLIAQGASNSEIAKKLLVSDATIKTHINHIFSKLEVRDRAQLIVKARQLELGLK